MVGCIWAHLGHPNIHKGKEKTNIRQFNVNLSLLALPCSRIPLMQGGVHYLPCGGWTLVINLFTRTIDAQELRKVTWKNSWAFKKQIMFYCNFCHRYLWDGNHTTLKMDGILLKKELKRITMKHWCFINVNMSMLTLRCSKGHPLDTILSDEVGSSERWVVDS